MLSGDSAVLICIDVQGNLARAMHNREALFGNLQKLIAGMRILGVPVIWTEQVPQGLGPTIPEIARLLDGLVPISKTSFSCCGSNDFLQALRRESRPQVLLAGIETHICIYQTAIDLVSMGHEVHIAADCVSSRHPDNHAIGLAKMKDAGAALTSAEIALFELLKTADAPQFRDIIRIVK